MKRGPSNKSLHKVLTFLLCSLVGCSCLVDTDPYYLDDAGNQDRGIDDQSVDRRADLATGEDSDLPDQSPACVEGMPCDSADDDLCLDDVTACDGNEVLCEDSGGALPDLCDGQDNDCNPETVDGSGEETFGDACAVNGRGCGTVQCVVLALTCIAEEVEIDLCDGRDNDCDSQIDEDHDSTTACDGDDADLCARGTSACTSGAITCIEEGPVEADVCDGSDNDCDGMVDESHVPVSCDSEDDADLCANGMTACRNGNLRCNGDSATRDLCNGSDDDCNPQTPDGSGENWYQTPCDSGSCTGVSDCVGGAQVCISMAPDVCNDEDDDCDSRVDEDCPSGCEAIPRGFECGSPMTWEEANQTCRKQGALLAPVTSSWADVVWVNDQLGYRHTDGSPLALNEMFFPSSPTPEQCVYVFTASGNGVLYRVEPCASVRRFVCYF